MNKENLANGLLASPVSTGATSATLQSGYGATMPAVPFKLTVTPFGQLSTKGNSEIWLVTARSGEVLTITRAQEGTTAKSFAAGDIVSNGIYVGDMMGSGSFVFKETPTGAVDGSNTSFTTSAPYVGGSLQVYINGLPQFDYLTEVTPGSGTFTLQDAPDTGDQVRVSYQQLITTFGNADTIDGYHANATPTANNIPVLDGNGKLPSGALNIPVARQNNTTNTTPDNPRIETGWGWMQFGSTSTNIAEAVTFSQPFSDRPIVVITMGGDAGNVAPSYGTGGNNIHGSAGAKAYGISSSGFTAYVWGGSYTAGQTVYYQWIAIGV